MEVTVKTTELSDVLRLVRPVTEKKTTIPILGTVLLTAERNRLLVTGTDLETGAICPCPATVRKPGKIAIPAQRLHEYVKVLPEGELDLKAQASNWLSLTCNRSRSRIAGLAAASYPELPEPPDQKLTVRCGILARLAEQVRFAISTDDSRQELSGALLKIDKSGITMVATDGHRLSFAQHPVDIEGLDSLLESVIPKKALADFLRFAEGLNTQDMEFSYTGNHLFFEWSNRRLLSRKGSGKFPSYERILPKAHPSAFTADRDELLASIERVSRFSDARTQQIIFDIGKGKCTLLGAQSDVGESEESFTVAHHGDSVRIGLKASYLSDFLDRTEFKHVRFSFHDANTAVELQPNSAEMAATHRYVVMPMLIAAK